MGTNVSQNPLTIFSNCVDNPTCFICFIINGVSNLKQLCAIKITFSFVDFKKDKNPPVANLADTVSTSLSNKNSLLPLVVRPVTTDALGEIPFVGRIYALYSLSLYLAAF